MSRRCAQFNRKAQQYNPRRGGLALSYFGPTCGDPYTTLQYWRRRFKAKIATLANTSFQLRSTIDNSELMSLIEVLVSLLEMFAPSFTQEKHAMLAKEVLMSVVENAVLVSK